jgi:hypothetical protein
MNKKLKIALMVGVPVVLIGAYFMFRKPSFRIKDINWDFKRGEGKFGNMPINFQAYKGLDQTVKGYRLIIEPVGEKLVFKVFDEGGALVSEETIDFAGKLRY